MFFVKVRPIKQIAQKINSLVYDAQRVSVWDFIDMGLKRVERVVIYCIYLFLIRHFHHPNICFTLYTLWS